MATGKVEKHKKIVDYTAMSASDLTANDALPVWDAEAVDTDRTRKITAQNLAAGVKSLGNLLGTGDVVNNLTSTATDKPLSAAQGKVLNDHIANNGYADITINPTYATGGGRCFKLGKIVFAQLRVKCATTVTISDVFAVVPVGFRPKARTADMTCGLYNSGTLNYYSQYCYVDTNGNINHALSSAGLPADTWIMMDFIYETD